MITVTAQSYPNIAFIKYWGNRDPVNRLPANGSISMNLDGLYTRTSVQFSADLRTDILTLSGQEIQGEALERVSAFLNHVRQMAGTTDRAEVTTQNNFPMGAGIASSASAFAALALAASKAAGLDLPEQELSRLARLGSGSACRSVPGGFVEWKIGESDEDSFAFSIAPPDHWDLVDCICVVSQAHKATGSTQGHSLADTSPLQPARVADAPRRLELCRRAILERDFELLTQIIELDSNIMHAVMMSSQPPILYWQPATIAVMQAVQELRQEGYPACYTIDAGPNVHVICTSSHSQEIVERLGEVTGVQKILTARPGGPARLV